MNHPLPLFQKVQTKLNQFHLVEPFVSEADLESKITKYLRDNKFHATTQKVSDNKRYDIICTDRTNTVCIELKTKADASNVKQFDKYHRDFPDGFIILCWYATKPLKEIFSSVQKQSPTNIALVEISNGNSMI